MRPARRTLFGLLAAAVAAPKRAMAEAVRRPMRARSVRMAEGNAAAVQSALRTIGPVGTEGEARIMAGLEQRMPGLVAATKRAAGQPCHRTEAAERRGVILGEQPMPHPEFRLEALRMAGADDPALPVAEGIALADRILRFIHGVEPTDAQERRMALLRSAQEAIVARASSGDGLSQKCFVQQALARAEALAAYVEGGASPCLSAAGA